MPLKVSAAPSIVKKHLERTNPLLLARTLLESLRRWRAVIKTWMNVLSIWMCSKCLHLKIVHAPKWQIWAKIVALQYMALLDNLGHVYEIPPNVDFVVACFYQPITFTLLNGQINKHRLEIQTWQHVYSSESLSDWSVPIFHCSLLR